mmetsp:Transcript_4627/g.8867  ORF Transcript_4627/g.8867 Transcript_4627/m.8867 type:complete len:216 (-) Transcript_4627:12-659(-)
MPLRKASYILDLRELPVPSRRFWDLLPPLPCQDDGTVSSVGVHLPGHDNLPPGLPVLKEAIRIVNAHYPELLARIFFYQAPMWFRMMFAIFSLWVDDVTRKKFVFVSQGEEDKFLQHISVSQLPKELGGQGISLDTDGFIAHAVERYDQEARRMNEAAAAAGAVGSVAAASSIGNCENSCYSLSSYASQGSRLSISSISSYEAYRSPAKSPKQKK